MLARLSGRTHRVLTGVALFWHQGKVQHSAVRLPRFNFGKSVLTRRLLTGKVGSPAIRLARMPFRGSAVVLSRRYLAATPALLDCPYSRRRTDAAERGPKSIDRMTDESPKEEILINVTSSEVRAALLENGVLQEVYVERSARRGVISAISTRACLARAARHAGGVYRYRPANAQLSLHVSDIAKPQQRRSIRTKNCRIFAILFARGRDVLVQVVKDPLGNKGARLTTHITLPSRHLVLLPEGDSVGVSARIEDEEERERLRQLVTELLEEEHELGMLARLSGPLPRALKSKSYVPTSNSWLSFGASFRNGAARVR